MTVLRDTLNEMTLIENIGARFLSYILNETAKEVNVTQITPGYQSISFTASFIWQFGVNSLIRHKLYEDVLQEALEKVGNAQKIDGEYESTYSYRLQALSRLCQGVLMEAELVFHLIKRLRTAIRTIVQNNIRTISCE